MQDVIALLDAAAADWMGEMWQSVWQSTLLAAGIYLWTRLGTRFSASFRFWLWMLIPLRLLLMPLLSFSLPVLPSQDIHDYVAAPAQAAVSQTAPVAPPPVPEVVQQQSSHPAPLPETSHSLGLPVLLFGLWIAGAMFRGTVFLGIWQQARRLAADARIADMGTLSEAARVAGTLGMRRVPQVWLCNKKIPPMTCGVLRPIVLLPSDFIRECDTETLNAVLVHEFAHVRRHDTRLGLLCALCECLYFFHPVVYLAKRHLSVERERACDDSVLSATRIRPSAYARILVATAETATHREPRLAMLPVVAESCAALRARLSSSSFRSGTPVRQTPLATAAIAALMLLCIPEFNLESRQAAAIITAQAPFEIFAALDKQSEDARILHFPEESVGVVEIRHAKSANDRFYEAWPFSDEFNWTVCAVAQGEVPVPADARVRLSVFPDAPEDASWLSQLQKNDLDALSLEQSANPERYLRAARHLTGLRCLKLRGTALSNDAVAQLSPLQNLECLELSSGPNGEALASLAALTKLRLLSLEGPRIDSGSYAPLAALPALEGLALWNVDVNVDSAKSFAQLPALRLLAIINSRVSAAGAASLAKLQQINALFLPGCQLDDESMPHLSRLQGLETLDLTGNPITAQGLAALGPLHRLKRLGLKEARLSDAALSALNAFPRLEVLELPQLGLGDEALAHVARLEHLRILDVNGVSPASNRTGPFTDRALLQLAALTQLESLDIATGTGITASGLRALQQLPRLRAFTLLGKNLQDDALQALANVSALEELTIFDTGETGMSVSGANSLNSLTRLRSLSLYNVTRRETALDLSGLTRLESLALGILEPREEKGALRNDDLAFVPKIPNLRTLRLGSGTHLDNSGLTNLMSLKQLETLDIGGSRLNDDAAKLLATLPALDSLILRGHFGDASLQHLASAKRLRRLYFEPGCTFTPEAVARFLAEHPGLYFNDGTGKQAAFGGG